MYSAGVRSAVWSLGFTAVNGESIALPPSPVPWPADVSIALSAKLSRWSVMPAS